MGVLQLPDDLSRLLESQVAQGRAASEVEFLADAVRHYTAVLGSDDAPIMIAAAEGIADIEAGRFLLIDGSDDMTRLRDELTAVLNETSAS